MKKLLVPLILSFISSSQGMALEREKHPIRKTFPEALLVYSAYLEGKSVESILRMYGSDAPASEAEALAWVLELQALPGAHKVGGGIVGAASAEYSCIKPERRWDISDSAIQHQTPALRDLEGFWRRFSYFMTTVPEEDMDAVSCERCALTPSCRAAASRWNGRSDFQLKRDREDLKAWCTQSAQMLALDVLEDGYSEGYVTDFSVCRPLISGADVPERCVVSMDGISLDIPNFSLHPSCLDQAKNSVEWSLQRARLDRLYRRSLNLMASCGVEEKADSRRPALAIPISREQDSFHLATCFKEPADITEGQAGLINFNPGWVADWEPQAYQYEERVSREVVERSFWGRETRRTETVIETRSTVDPQVVESKKARLPRPLDQYSRVKPAELRAVNEFSRLLALDAIRNSKARFKHGEGSVPSRESAELLASLWVMDCVSRLPGVRAQSAQEIFKNSPQVLEACKSGELPPVPDAKQRKGFAAACRRLRAPPASPRPVASDDDDVSEEQE